MIYRKLRPQYYNDIGMVNENGEKWHSLRRNLTPPLSSTATLKHYATQHFYEELLGQLRQEPGYSAPASPALERQMVIHYAVNQGAVKKMLEKMGAGQNTEGVHRWEQSVYKTIVRT